MLNPGACDSYGRFVCAELSTFPLVSCRDLGRDRCCDKYTSLVSTSTMFRRQPGGWARRGSGAAVAR